MLECSAHELLQRDLCTPKWTPQTKMRLAQSSRRPIEEKKKRKSESTHLLCYNVLNHTTYENVMSIAINDLSHWDVLACEESSAKRIGTNSG